MVAVEVGEEVNLLQGQPVALLQRVVEVVHLLLAEGIQTQ
jgi:hypothetical protein